jgi:hypothetical protein
MSTRTENTEPDPVLQAYRTYEEDGKIRFERFFRNYYGTGGTRRWYVYHVNRRELWRIYIRTKRDWKRAYAYNGPMSYIKANRLVPMWPKHMQVDKGL